MSNIAIFRISVALNINFHKVRDTEFQGVWTELRVNFVFSDNPSQNTLTLIYEIE